MNIEKIGNMQPFSVIEPEEVPLQKENSETIYAGDLELAGKNTIAAQKALSQKHALQTILDQFKKGREIDENIEKRELHKKALVQDIKDIEKKLDMMSKSREYTLEFSNVDPDSQEHRNFEIMQKRLNGKPLTEEEEEIYNSLGVDMHLFSMSIRNPERLSPEQRSAAAQMPLTEYQRDLLTDDIIKDMLMEERTRKVMQKEQESHNIEDIKQALLSSAPMVDAVNEADTLMEQAGKEALSAMILNGKESIDKNKEENEEKVEEIKEKKEDEQEKTEKKVEQIDRDNPNYTDKNMNINTETLNLIQDRIRSLNDIAEAETLGDTIDEYS